MCRMNGFHDYDWAAPSSQACQGLLRLIKDLKRQLALNLIVSCAVINHKQGASAEEYIGEGCRLTYKTVHDASYHHLPSSQSFSFSTLFDKLKI